MSMALEGIRILDWTLWQQGPVATQMLGDLGAEVIKIEERLGGDPGRGMMKIIGSITGVTGDRNFYFEANNRNKRGFAVDLKKEKGRQLVYKLVEKSDVFVQNFRKGVAARLGMGYQTLSRYNPKLIYATATGYGPEGPESGEPSFDFMGLARSGIMTAVGEPDMPPLSPGSGLADQMGAILLSYGILVALVARERLGIGQQVDSSHLSSMMQLQGLNISSRLILGQEFQRKKRTAAGNPLWNYYRCGDDRWLCLAMPQSDRYWPGFCVALGIPECAADSRFQSMDGREQHCQEIIAILDRAFATRSRAEWMDILKKSGDFIYTVVNTIGDLPDDPQVIANKYVEDFDHPVLGTIKMMGLPVKLSQTPGSIRLPAPELGQHTEEILIELLGYDWDEIVRLKDEEVI